MNNAKATLKWFTHKDFTEYIFARTILFVCNETNKKFHEVISSGEATYISPIYQDEKGGYFYDLYDEWGSPLETIFLLGIEKEKLKPIFIKI